MRILKNVLLNKFEEEELGNALAYVNAYANLSSRLGKYEEANALYWLKSVALDTFSKPEGILLKASIDYGYRLYAVYNLSNQSFLQPIDGEEAEELSKDLPLKVDTYLGSYNEPEGFEGFLYEDLCEAIKVIYDFIHEVDERFTWELEAKEEEYQFYLLEASRGKTLKALKEEEEQEKEEEEFDFDFDEE